MPSTSFDAWRANALSRLKESRYAPESLLQIGGELVLKATFAEASRAVSELLRDESYQVQWATLTILEKTLAGDLFSASISDALIQLEGHSSELAVNLLRELRGEPLSGLRRAAAGADNAACRYHAIKALADINDTEAVPYIRAGLETAEDRRSADRFSFDESWSDVREVALSALAQLGDTTIIPLLVRALASNTREERQLAAELLWVLGAERTIPELMNHLSAEDPARWGAQSVLRSFGLESLPALQIAHASTEDLSEKRLIIELEAAIDLDGHQIPSL